MNILEKFSKDNLFEQINSINPLPWGDYTYINMLWLKNYGSRKLLINWEKTTVSDIANIINVLYMPKWKILYKNTTTDILVDGNKIDTTTKIITDSNNISRETNNESIHKVSAFDSNDFSDDTNDIDNINLTESVNNDRKEVTEIKGKNGNFTNEFLAFNSFLTNTKFFDMIISDVNNVLTIKVLECDL